MKVWVTRDKGGYWEDAVQVNDYQMAQDDDGNFEMINDNTPHIIAVGAEWFENHFNLPPPAKGSCRQYELTLTKSQGEQ